MQQHARDLIGAGAYLCAVCLLTVALGAGASALLKDGPESPLFGWVGAVVESQPQSTTRLSEALRTSREIQAAISQPIPEPEPLPPITAHVAIGKLRPDANHARVRSARKPLSREARDAMAMDVQAPRQTFKPPELHKVY